MREACMVKRTMAFLAALALAGTAQAQTTFRVVNHSDLKTLQITLKAPPGIMLQALSQPSGAAFIMPKKVAETDPFKQIDDYTGSGPFIFVKNEWKPGDKTVYVRNPKYKPRAEPASGLAGGKIAKLDRVEWVAIPEQQTATSALIKGEIDMIETPQHDLL